MTYHEWQDFARKTHAQADRTSHMIAERGRDIGQRIGLGRDMAFHLAHNALCGEVWCEYRSPEGRRALRTILYLERRSFEPHRIADRVIDRAWKSVRLEGK